MNYNDEIWRKISEEERLSGENQKLFKAIKREKKTGFFEFLQDMVIGLGIRNVFRGVYDVLFITLTAAALMFALFRNSSGNYAYDSSIYGIIFTSSPAVYFLFFLLSAVKERQDGIFEVKMTCRYTAVHVCAFRMFIAGIGCMTLNAAFTACAAEVSGEIFWGLMAVSFSSLFIFALIIISALLHWGAKGMYIPGSLIALSAFGTLFEEYTLFLRNIPAAAYFILGIIAALMFQKTLNNINRRYSYAVR